MSLILRYAARSDRGLVRSNNEDSVYAGPRLLALADGMGGHAAGEVASQLMITALAPLDDDEPGGDLLGTLEEAMVAGNETIADQVAEDPELDGMGTTLTAILFAGSKLGLIHVGDSRGYLLRDGQLTRITKDDTFVQTLVDEGRITAEQAHTHPQRSLIMKALTGHEVEPTLTLREAKAGDVYLLCSDGLSDVVSDETIGDTLELAVEDCSAAADKLIELALRSGGPDNVTVVVARVEDTSFGQSRPIVGGAANEDDEDYVPPSNTAAGRAAALRPPRKAPRRVVAQEVDDEPERGPRRKWIALGVLLVLLIGGAVGVIATRSVVNSNYYVGATDNGTIAIYRGVKVSLLGKSLHDQQEVVCLADSPGGDGTAGAASMGCTPLTTKDLTPRGRANLDGLPYASSIDDARNQARALTEKDNLIPRCRVSTEIIPVPAPPPAATPPPPGGETLTPPPPPETKVVTQTSTPDEPCRGGPS
ncbi:protein-serine/threonine phosphatase OS=Tsukamurella paurometabola (strain ATCC 8368 / DSM /CCUG 35730 / CIP 100753 / JCM 10117 / KCTC 9821 / NBRC 16120/ NCIMB 702349 / NCTC 13040) OX=521096 GN=Tpau_0031 PE=4 SV=1 [Tsukamurella paurometabola]|uniref:Serine/threonine protein phosphatase PstP n=1 Tax=Tsukamurella paurometabola (strain ATCC 8368 / DSM 20162 / CCUG 35730 / CIP 100753 / JCM 10117 / KCTC 9821 / NBRC 16120 / NCIMB 702349 / NCTC 13040) TaxID=521096 RepID=D5UPR7_TSUPD|nr:PP2C family serine/threonine-protein phosphatase [Tsukamurella paurometabola]ADG76685.1 protein serine/threonine phosphatase [Tsukamurella paurometabola DSM 20162]SUP41213.1 PP2C-family Ser/Thr phosphatase [Tsukamurella paurometabola]